MKKIPVVSSDEEEEDSETSDDSTPEFVPPDWFSKFPYFELGKLCIKLNVIK